MHVATRHCVAAMRGGREMDELGMCACMQQALQRTLLCET
jgi:hypothetical protein